jgi:hypothetical protein
MKTSLIKTPTPAFNASDYVQMIPRIFLPYWGITNCGVHNVSIAAYLPFITYKHGPPP